jgi:hypothetical protein
MDGYMLFVYNNTVGEPIMLTSWLSADSGALAERHPEVIYFVAKLDTEV